MELGRNDREALGKASASLTSSGTRGRRPRLRSGCHHPTLLWEEYSRIRSKSGFGKEAFVRRKVQTQTSDAFLSLFPWRLLSQNVYTESTLITEGGYSIDLNVFYAIRVDKEVRKGVDKHENSRGHRNADAVINKTSNQSKKVKKIIYHIKRSTGC